MIKKTKIKQLLEFYTSLSRPYGVLIDIFVALYPRFRKISNIRSSIGKPNKKLATTVGYDGFELGLWANSLFLPNWDIDQKSLSRLKKSKFRFARFHACFEMLPEKFKGIHLNLASDEVENNIKAVKSHIDIAREISSVDKPLVVFHPGFVKKESEKKNGLKNIIKVLNTVARYAEEKHVVIGIENLLWNRNIYYLGSNIDELITIIDAVNSPYIKAVFDWGHLNTYAAAKKIENPSEYIDEQIIKLGKRIAHIHLNYNTCCEKGYEEYTPSYKRFFNKVFGKRPQEGDESGIGEVLDQHLPITAAKGEYRKKYTRNLETLFTYSAIHDHGGYITHEVDPKKLFGIIPFNEKGAGIQEHVQDLTYVKNVAENIPDSE